MVVRKRQFFTEMRSIMTLEQCYQVIGGDYQEVLQRLMNESLVRHFLDKFLKDASYDNIFANLESGDMQEAFRAAHTLKGLCQNLGLGNLYRSSYQVTEALRDGNNGTTTEMLDQLKADYSDTVAAIQAL